MNAVVAPRLVYVVTDSVSTALLRQQLRAMRLRGFDVTVISSPGERLEQCAREEGVRAVPMPMARPIRPWQDLKSLIGLFLALRSLRPHVVNAGTPKAALLGSNRPVGDVLNGSGLWPTLRRSNGGSRWHGEAGMSGQNWSRRADEAA